MGEARQSGNGKKSKMSSRTKPQVVPPPLKDEELELMPDDIPDESQIDEVANKLNPEDRAAFAEARRLLAEHLGSHAAARLWFVTRGTGFETTALDAVRKGQAKVVLETLKSQWGPSPSYA